jgi:hypothetical protein
VKRRDVLVWAANGQAQIGTAKYFVRVRFRDGNTEFFAQVGQHVHVVDKTWRRAVAHDLLVGLGAVKAVTYIIRDEHIVVVL